VNGEWFEAKRKENTSMSGGRDGRGHLIDQIPNLAIAALAESMGVQKRFQKRTEFLVVCRLHGHLILQSNREEELVEPFVLHCCCCCWSRHFFFGPIFPVFCFFRPTFS